MSVTMPSRRYSMMVDVVPLSMSLYSNTPLETHSILVSMLSLNLLTLLRLNLLLILELKVKPRLVRRDSMLSKHKERTSTRLVQVPIKVLEEEEEEAAVAVEVEDQLLKEEHQEH